MHFKGPNFGVRIINIALGRVNICQPIKINRVAFEITGSGAVVPVIFEGQVFLVSKRAFVFWVLVRVFG